jgi:hypothetical protein
MAGVGGTAADEQAVRAVSSASVTERRKFMKTSLTASVLFLT